MSKVCRCGNYILGEEFDLCPSCMKIELGENKVEFATSKKHYDIEKDEFVILPFYISKNNTHYVYGLIEKINNSNLADKIEILHIGEKEIVGDISNISKIKFELRFKTEYFIDDNGNKDICNNILYIVNVLNNCKCITYNIVCKDEKNVIQLVTKNTDKLKNKLYILHLRYGDVLAKVSNRSDELITYNKEIMEYQNSKYSELMEEEVNSFVEIGDNLVLDIGRPTLAEQSLHYIVDVFCSVIRFANNTMSEEKLSNFLDSYSFFYDILSWDTLNFVRNRANLSGGNGNPTNAEYYFGDYVYSNDDDGDYVEDDDDGDYYDDED